MKAASSLIRYNYPTFLYLQLPASHGVFCRLQLNDTVPSVGRHEASPVGLCSLELKGPYGRRRGFHFVPINFDTSPAEQSA